MPKLRFAFTGICALSPGWPRDGAPAPNELTAVIPQSRAGRIASDGSTYVAAHLPFLFVPLANLAPGSRGADYVITRSDGEECAVIFLDREELTIANAPAAPLRYVVGDAPIGERPTPDDIADIRWAADFREVDPSHATLRPGLRDATADVDAHVAARVRLTSGTVSSRFPCPEGPSTSFLNAPNPVHRQFAQEVIVEVDFGAESEATLATTRFDAPPPPLPIVLQFAGADIEAMIGNGPLDSVMNLRDNDCAGHMHPGAVDYEFEIYYDVLDYPSGVPLPVPRLDPLELRHADCLSLFVE